MQPNNSNLQATQEVQDACIVLLRYMQEHNLKTFYFGGDYDTSVRSNGTDRKGRLVVYAALDQKATNFEKRLISDTNGRLE